MPAKVKAEAHLEIAHVLFIDVVGYSKLLVNEQRDVVHQLTQIVRKTPQFRRSEAAGRLISIPAGDGMALVFFRTPEEPVQCAMEIAKAVRSYPQLRLRMGVHSGPVDQVKDVNKRSNVAGAGINIAQRVMACGDAGHILLSKRVAEDLAQDSHWRPHLHELGEVELKHGDKIDIVNLYSEEVGNSQLPQRFKELSQKRGAPSIATGGGSIFRNKWAVFAAVLLVVAAFALGFWKFRRPITLNTTGASKPITEKSIAVLPFDNLSDDKQNAYFADGMQDEILTDLAKIADLKVISRISVMQYKAGTVRNLRDISKALGVAHLVEGSVQRVANRVRVNTQLIDARTDTHIWAESYDRDIADVFAIQSEIAKKIADQLEAKLSPREKAEIERPPTTDLVAFDLYTRAKTLLLSFSFNSATKDKVLEGVELLNQAIARDPAFFDAYVQLVWGHGVLYLLNFDHSETRRSLADAALHHAMRLRPDAGETHFALADFLYRCYLDYDRARAELEIAKGALPNSSQVFSEIGYIDRRQGRWQDSTRNMEKALQLDPQNFFLLQQISLSYRSLRRYQKEAAILDRALTLVPNDVDTRVARAVVELEWHADPKPLREVIQRILSENPAAGEGFAGQWLYGALCERDPTEATRAISAIPSIGTRSDAVIFPRLFSEGLAARARGDAAAARDAFTKARAEVEYTIRSQPDYGPPLCVLGMVDAGLGRKDEAIREGQHAIELLPLAKDAINGAHVMKYLAVIYAWTGDKDRAIEQLSATLRIPGQISYGELRLHPNWDPLRGDPRFEQLVAEAANPVPVK